MWDDLAKFLSQPLDEEGNALHWFAFVGLLLAFVWLWHMIARDWQRLEG